LLTNNCILDAVRKNKISESSSEADIEDSIKTWLKNENALHSRSQQIAKEDVKSGKTNKFGNVLPLKKNKTKTSATGNSGYSYCCSKLFYSASKFTPVF
jgi:hypothetical protein